MVMVPILTNQLVHSTPPINHNMTQVIERVPMACSNKHAGITVRKKNYLRLTTIRVKNPHGIIGAIDARQYKDNSVSSNAEVPITQLHRFLCTDPGLGRVSIVNLFKITRQNRTRLFCKEKRSGTWTHQNEVVSEAVVLGEMEEAGLLAVEEGGG